MVCWYWLLEIFLVNEFGYCWDEVYDEVEVFEYVVLDCLMVCIDVKLGFL